MYSVWGDMIKFKFAAALLLTPLVDPLVIMMLEFAANEEDLSNYIDRSDMLK